MHTDSGMTGISLSGYMPYMTVASLEMSDEPKKSFIWIGVRDGGTPESRIRDITAADVFI